ncbi:uncharacterized protein B0I36DRAFT_365351 [Microdochium trichocladiopsis]|uniref:DUF7702 domain-containing protein n=1 Tax=Microdochium trichocladiopsis TaxID=1682393 RepID=A0A9P8Y1Y7_9PEZI|nr:uncharacterized protein B0I36DRAFT_365351 [Microdochium trichocladiopsis]KAH7025673.1 hypothetical protein B0I36DRAFT_365351 [Microdochium trichocladiopsis]
MTLSTQSAVSVVQLAFFIPFLFLSGWMIVKHGFRSAGGGWRYITILGLLRIIGSSCEIAGESSPTNKSLRTVVLICNSIGLAPLLLQCTGLVTRANISIKSLPNRFFSIANLVGTAGMVIAIIGAVKAVNSTSGQFEINDFMVAGISLFIVLFALTLLAVVSMGTGMSTIASSTHREHLGARRIVMALALCVPFLVVRIVYACIGTYGKNTNYMPGMGDPLVYLGMTVITEIIVVCICLALGIILPAPSDPVAEYKGYAGSGRV